MAKPLPIHSRIIAQMAKATVKNLINGIVELVTNSDDSYRRIGHEADGRIVIRVKRGKGGHAESLAVEDFGQGMGQVELEEAVEFGGETSGFEEGRSVRGYFGRGLKETIIALGIGEIETVRDGQLSRTRLWLDEKEAQYDDEMLKDAAMTDRKNGTRVAIRITNKEITAIPQHEKFKEQLSNHYALREIFSSAGREVWLEFQDATSEGKKRGRLTFSWPKGKLVEKTEICMPVAGDAIELTLYETPSPLSSPRNNPYGLAGILIRTDTAILDNQLFRFENEPAGLYFYGIALCNGLEERLRAGQAEIIDQNRGGLARNHPYFKEMSEVIEDILEPHVLRKKAELEEGATSSPVNKSTKQLLRDICNLLNEIAADELPEEQTAATDQIIPIINDLTVKPEVANVSPDTPRTLTIYAPISLVKQHGTVATVRSDHANIVVPTDSVVLHEHHKRPDKLYVKHFLVMGKKLGAEGRITVKLGNQRCFAKVTVAPLSTKPRVKITGRRRGFISAIEPDPQRDPTQRVFYTKGVIKIFTNFPSVRKHLGDAFEGVEKKEGRLLLAELVGEAFCREATIRGFERGRFHLIPHDEIGSFITQYTELQKKYLHKIQEVVLAWKFGAVV